MPALRNRWLADTHLTNRQFSLKHFIETGVSIMVAPIEQAWSPAETRRRLIKASGHAFADIGFRSVIVREFCNRA